MFVTIALPPVLRVFALDASSGSTVALTMDVAQWGREMPAPSELAMVAVIGVGVLVLAVAAVDERE